jgi:hypothetical protein
MGAEDVYYQPDKAGKRLVILGRGLSVSSLAFIWRRNGRAVTIVEMLPELTVDQFSMHTLALIDQIEKLGIKVLTSTCVSEITTTGVSVTGPGGAQSAFRRHCRLRRRPEAAAGGSSRTREMRRRVPPDRRLRDAEEYLSCHTSRVDYCERYLIRH